MHPMFDLAVNAHWSAVTIPQYGQQHKGITPGGALDLFAHETGQVLLSNPASAESVEFIFPLRCRIRMRGWVVLTGAWRTHARLCRENGIEEPVPHGQVFPVHPGQTLDFGAAEYGFRSYLSWRTADAESDALELDRRNRGDFGDIFSWPDPEGGFRCMRGPEWPRLQNPDLVEQAGWRVSRELSNQGLRLEHVSGQLSLNDSELVSSAVADGTVQLTPSGPFVLLRHRQTLGGYPRILNVISADVDLLAQLAPGQSVHFKLVGEDEARTVARLKAEELAQLKRSLAG